MSAKKKYPKDATTPITELRNELTIDIDVGTATDIARTLRQCDAQIFSGWKDFPSVLDENTIEAMDKVAEKAKEILRDNSGDKAIVISGCGTSGRLAYFLAHKFSQLAEAQQISACYDYLIAGGDIALFTSQEAPEDDWKRGEEDLIHLSRSKKQVLFIGITCGLSAPYVAGQLDHCMRHRDTFIPVLLGFNPVHQARKNPIEQWDKSFFDVANALEDYDKGIILNPVVGPEAITGSSRMKGGSATKILLESILLKAHASISQPRSVLNRLTEILLMYENMYRRTYLSCSSIACAIELAAESLKSNGHVFYIGWGLNGFMGLLDASECVPTFSANFDDVRGFIEEGYSTLNNREGELMLTESKKLCIALEDFKSNFLPELTVHDTVVFILPDNKVFQEVTQLIHLIKEKGTQLIGIIFQKESELSNLFKSCIHVEGNHSSGCLNEEGSSTPILLTDFLNQCLQEISIKWILNAISTGAHVLKGKVLRGLMIDVKVSNNKLFHRAISIVSTFARVDQKCALHAVLKAIYRRDSINDVLNLQISEHVAKGTVMDQVVPVAVLIATDKFSIASAVEALRTSTVSHILKNLGLVE